MPAVTQSGNSQMVAIVTGNANAAAKQAAFHAVPEICGYDGYDALLASGSIDAVCIALPWLLSAIPWSGAVAPFDARRISLTPCRGRSTVRQSDQ